MDCKKEYKKYVKEQKEFKPSVTSYSQWLIDKQIYGSIYLGLFLFLAFSATVIIASTKPESTAIALVILLVLCFYSLRAAIRNLSIR